MTVPTSVQIGKEVSLHVSVPRLSGALASAAVPIMTTSVTVVASSNDAIVVPCRCC